MDLARQRCLLHPLREAAARCPECGQFHCRECVTEHDGRVLCTPCLRRLAAARTAGDGTRRFLSTAWQGLQLAVAFVFLWFCFFVAGQFLARTPQEFHNGALFRGR
ncbi:MAG: rhomboid family protein [Verrucomicrobia bacterium]|nr:rhomboid family protein [Verrucomicrobiota bacterium]